MHPNKFIRYGEKHHWWPIGLSKGWARPDGRINTISQHGVPKAYFPKEIAKIADGHNIIMGGTWDETFEHQFAQPDNNFPSLVSWLEGIHNEPQRDGKRVRPVDMTDELRLKLSQCVASLIVRSPTMRHRIYVMLRHYNHRGGADPYRAPNHLVAVNMRNLYDSFSRSINASGRFALLVAESEEFIFGDGFLNNFPITWMPEPMNPLCLVPLSPKISVLFQRPMSMWAEPKAVALTLDSSEVSFCNDTIQVYSKEWLYYRHHAPTIEHFREREHQEWSMPGEWGSQRHHAHPILERLKEEILAYHPYGD
jgi:hypothetical protein